MLGEGQSPARNSFWKIVELIQEKSPHLIALIAFCFENRSQITKKKLRIQDQPGPMHPHFICSAADMTSCFLQNKYLPDESQQQVRFDKIKIMQEIIIKRCSIAREIIGRHLA